MQAKDIAEKYRMMSPEEVDLLKQCASDIPKDATVINIGLNVGTSLIAILEACPGATVVNIDKKPCPEAQEHLKQCGLGNKSFYLLQGDSTRVDTSGIKSAALIFVDGGHTDEVVQADIENFRPKVPVGGYMLFHDYNHPIYATKKGIHLDDIVNEAMQDWQKVGQARYLVAFKRVK